MKKLLSLIGSFGFSILPLTNIFPIISCSIQNPIVKELSYADGKSNKDVLNFLLNPEIKLADSFKDSVLELPLQITDDNKLAKDYLNIYDEKIVDDNITYEIQGIEGNQVILDSIFEGNSFPTELIEIFPELEDLKSNIDFFKYSGTTHLLSLKGYKGSSNFTLFIYEVNLSLKKKGLYETRKTTNRKLYKIDVEI
ncbi:hypothetical protein SLITO_v1c07440 [Spiroplasma litorale]|uniref:Uncharacterized protein n=1 Tax=Spiroplasma litorale TaxID=216942 RepID=A0A0K1W2Q7_9MOLU|nr:hypothetical protein [Spiroplasma litorale]AKX34367.1 hypothetical protein SLITO_v1c07440 [Spiroplasma litorale]